MLISKKQAASTCFSCRTVRCHSPEDNSLSNYRIGGPRIHTRSSADRKWGYWIHTMTGYDLAIPGRNRRLMSSSPCQDRLWWPLRYCIICTGALSFGVELPTTDLASWLLSFTCGPRVSSANGKLRIFLTECILLCIYITEIRREWQSHNNVRTGSRQVQSIVTCLYSK
jgi:hypothetical protein